VPRLCELCPGNCLKTEEKAQENLSQGCQRVPVGMMKTYLKHNCNSHSNISMYTDWSNAADFKDLCCSMYCFFVLFVFCVVLCTVCFVSFSVLFACICVLNYCHWVATQLQLNISYQYFVSKDFDSYYGEMINVLYYNSESHSQRLSMVRKDGVKEIHGIK